MTGAQNSQAVGPVVISTTPQRRENLQVDPGRAALRAYPRVDSVVITVSDRQVVSPRPDHRAPSKTPHTESGIQHGDRAGALGGFT